MAVGLPSVTSFLSENRIKNPNVNCDHYSSQLRSLPPHLNPLQDPQPNSRLNPQLSPLDLLVPAKRRWWWKCLLITKILRLKLGTSETFTKLFWRITPTTLSRTFPKRCAIFYRNRTRAMIVQATILAMIILQAFIHASIAFYFTMVESCPMYDIHNIQHSKINVFQF